MLLIYYNENQKHFYVVYTRHSVYDKSVGDRNSFGHTIVQMLIFVNDKLYNIQTTRGLMYSSFKPKKEKIIVRFLNRLIRFLNKLRKNLG